ncbi:Proline-, glutamic acid- and leucine-rich protein 1, partial [Linum perenne]
GWRTIVSTAKPRKNLKPSPPTLSLSRHSVSVQASRRLQRETETMSALESLKDMYDVALKPRMLRTLINEDVPNEKKPFDSPSKLSRVVSMIQTHKLLSESFSQAMDHKLTSRWKSAVDDWVNRLLLLMSTPNMPDKSWAGICLLGVTCQECSSERFVTSYTVWFDKLLAYMQSSGDSQFLKVASCASMSDLITRLAGFPKLKKDGASCAGKLIQPILKMLDEDSPETVQERAVHLLCTIITSFPASLPRYYDSVEAAIASRMLSGNGSLSVQKKLAYCLALLPKSRGDEDSWLLLIRKILLLLNGYLTDVFDGLEDANKWDEAVRLLVPPGEVPPQMIWGQNLVEKVSGKDRRRSKLSPALLLMSSCSMMLTNSYPNQVHVPVRSLLALVERVLMVHGSLPNAMSFVIAAEQEYVCSELPRLHSYSLEILSSVIKGMRSQLLPHAAYIVRLVKEYFKRCQLPDLRQKLYAIAKMLLISMGVGIAIYLAQEVVKNSLIDLTSVADHTFGGSSNVSSETWLQSYQKKRKYTAMDAGEQQQNSVTMELPSTNYKSATVSVKLAALEAIEACLTVGGAFRSKSWRSSVDNLLINIVENCCKGRWGSDERSFLSNEPTSMHSDFQLAALKALLASLLSPSGPRPPHLAQSLELFRRGRQETGTRISDFCAHALLALEVLIHPRALSLIDSLSINSLDGFEDSAGQKPSTPFSLSNREAEHGGNSGPNDDLYQSWIDDSKGTEGSTEIVGRQTIVEEGTHLEAARVQSEEMNHVNPWRNNLDATAATETGNTRIGNDEMMVDSVETNVRVEQLKEFASAEAADDSVIDKVEVTRKMSDNAAHPVSVTVKDASLVSRKSGTTAAGAESDNESTDSFPDIVYADPDSD